MLEDLLDYAKYVALGKQKECKVFERFSCIDLFWSTTTNSWYVNIDHPYMSTDNESVTEAVKELIEKIKSYVQV